MKTWQYRLKNDNFYPISLNSLTWLLVFYMNLIKLETCAGDVVSRTILVNVDHIIRLEEWTPPNSEFPWTRVFTSMHYDEPPMEYIETPMTKSAVEKMIQYSKLGEQIQVGSVSVMEKIYHVRWDVRSNEITARKNNESDWIHFYEGYCGTEAKVLKQAEKMLTQKFNKNSI